jgi:uncharacterized delta-60 repeat protein
MKLKLLFVLLPCIVMAQNPVRDNSFSGNGTQTTNLGPNSDQINAILVQPDGKVIAGGLQTDNVIYGPQRFAIVRYTADGELDTSFNGTGIVKTEFGSQQWLRAMALQPDGKILAAGQMSMGLIIARYQDNGTLDPAFGTAGSTYLDPGPNFVGTGSIFDISLLPDGKILAIARYEVAGGHNLRIIRFNINGMPDASFGTNGSVISTIPIVEASAMALKADGKFVVTGRCKFTPEGQSEQWRLYVAQFNADGSADTTFATNGVYIGESATVPKDVAIDNAGRIIVVGDIGTNQQGTSGDVFVKRFTSAGVPDVTFGSGGTSVKSVDSYADYANAVVVQPDNKIILGGSYFNFGGGSVTDCMVIRFNENGTADSTFGVNGVFKAGMSGGTDQVTDMAFTPDNKLILGGYGHYGNVNFFDFAIQRLVLDISTTLAAPVLKNESQFTIYPNPVSSSVIITSSSIIDNIQLLDSNGRILINTPVNAMQGQLDVSAYSTGVYYIKAVSAAGSSIQKLLKK